MSNLNKLIQFINYLNMTLETFQYCFDTQQEEQVYQLCLSMMKLFCDGQTPISLPIASSVTAVESPLAPIKKSVEIETPLLQSEIPRFDIVETKKPIHLDSSVRRIIPHKSS